MKAAEREAEAALVATCAAYPALVPELNVDPWHFISPGLSRIWGAMLDLSRNGDAWDVIAVMDLLESMDEPTDGVLEATKRADMISPTSVNDWSRVVRSGWVTRQTKNALADTLVAADRGVGGGDLVTLALQKLSNIDVEAPDLSLSIGELAKERLAQLGEIARRKEAGEVAATGILTGLWNLDDKLGGFQRGICTVVAGRPGMGKSAFAQSMTDSASSDGVGVHVFSLEDTRDAYADRALSRLSKVSAESIRSCELRVGDMTPIKRAADDLLRRKGWLVDDRSGITADEIVRTVRRARRKNKTDLVVVDYIQLVKAPREARFNRRETIDNAMDTFSDAAKQDRMSYMVLSQLNRSCELRDDKRPLLADLRESGGIEERAKCVLFLYRPAVYDEKAPEDLIEIIVRKNSNGETGVVEANWHGPTTRIY
jgi:replicative DNA helicase